MRSEAIPGRSAWAAPGTGMPGRSAWVGMAPRSIRTSVQVRPHAEQFGIAPPAVHMPGVCRRPPSLGAAYRMAPAQQDNHMTQHRASTPWPSTPHPVNASQTSARLGVVDRHPGGCPDMPRCRSGRQPYRAAIPTLVPRTTEHVGTYLSRSRGGGSPVTASVSGDVLALQVRHQYRPWPASTGQRTTASLRRGWRAPTMPRLPHGSTPQTRHQHTAGSASAAALRRHHQKEKR